jgi:hypothetical protein
VAWRASHLWAAYLIRERGISVDSALAQTRLINLTDDMRATKGRQPVEEFLNQDITLQFAVLPLEQSADAAGNERRNVRENYWTLRSSG